MVQKLNLTQNMTHKLQLKLIGKIKVAEFLSIPEPDFEHHIEKLEKSPLFITLEKKYRIISYRKFYDIRGKKTSEFREQDVAGESELEMEELLFDSSTFDLVKRIGKTIGEENFQKILTGKAGIEEVVKKCSLSPSEIRIFQQFVDRFQLQQIISPPSSSAFFPRPRFFLIASFEWEKDNLVIRPTKEESYLVKGRYQINYQRFKELVDTGKIKKDQADRMVKLLQQLEMINRRTTAIYRILHHLKEFQSAFFKSGNLLDLLPSSQSELARCLNFHPSTVSRAIANKSILTPQGEERPIEFFYSRRWTRNLIRKVILEEKERVQKRSSSSPLTDELIRQKIIKDYGINLSRRTVSKYRKALNIPPSHQRYKQ